MTSERTDAKCLYTRYVVWRTEVLTSSAPGSELADWQTDVDQPSRPRSKTGFRQTGKARSVLHQGPVDKAEFVVKAAPRKTAPPEVYYSGARDAIFALVDSVLGSSAVVRDLPPEPAAPFGSWDLLCLHVVDTPADTEAAPDPVDIAAAAFARALRVHPGVYALDVDGAEALGTRAAELAGSGVEWLEHVGEVIDVHAAQDVLRVGSRQAVYDLVKRHRLLGLRRSGGAMAIPTFQIDPATGRPYRAVPAILAVFAEAEVDAYSVASWFNTAQVELGGRTPTAILRDPGADHLAVTQCARAAASRWSQ